MTSWFTDCSHNIYEKKFIAEVHWKWDFCTHWRFYGEDYDDKPKLDFIDVQKYATRGSYENWLKKGGIMNVKQDFDMFE